MDNLARMSELVTGQCLDTLEVPSHSCMYLVLISIDIFTSGKHYSSTLVIGSIIRR